MYKGLEGSETADGFASLKQTLLLKSAFCVFLTAENEINNFIIPSRQHEQHQIQIHSRRGLVGASTLRSTPISRARLGKNPMPGHLSELHPVNEVNTKGQ